MAEFVPHKSETIQTLDPDPMLAGARFLGDPVAPLSTEDWPEDLK